MGATMWINYRRPLTYFKEMIKYQFKTNKDTDWRNGKCCFICIPFRWDSIWWHLKQTSRAVLKEASHGSANQPQILSVFKMQADRDSQISFSPPLRKELKPSQVSLSYLVMHSFNTQDYVFLWYYICKSRKTYCRSWVVGLKCGLGITRTENRSPGWLTECNKGISAAGLFRTPIYCCLCTSLFTAAVSLQNILFKTQFQLFYRLQGH